MRIGLIRHSRRIRRCRSRRGLAGGFLLLTLSARGQKDADQRKRAEDERLAKLDNRADDLAGAVPALDRKLDALSAKRQRALPVNCRVYDLLNFASELATHHTSGSASRVVQAWIGTLISREYDLEESCDAFCDFRDFFLDRKLNGELAMDLQRDC